MLDVGTGSGAIALAIADEHAGAEVTAVDSSTDALEVALANAAAAELAARVRFLRHDLTEGLDLGEFDLVVSNPPYIRPDEIDALEPEVRDWEPRGRARRHGSRERGRCGRARVPASGRVARSRGRRRLRRESSRPSWRRSATARSASPPT